MFSLFSPRNSCVLPVFFVDPKASFELYAFQLTAHATLCVNGRIFHSLSDHSLELSPFAC